MVRSLNLNCSIAIRHTIYVSLCFLLFQTVDCEICDSTKKKCFLFSHFLYKLLHCIVTRCMILFCYCFVSFNFSWKCSHWMLTAPLWIAAHITETNNALEHIPRGQHKSLLEIRASSIENNNRYFVRYFFRGDDIKDYLRYEHWKQQQIFFHIFIPRGQQKSLLELRAFRTTTDILGNLKFIIGGKVQLPDISNMRQIKHKENFWRTALK